MDQQSPAEATGIVVRIVGKQVVVLLESGEEVSCRWGRNDPWGNVIGTRVRIRFRPIRKDKSPLIVKWFAE